MGPVERLWADWTFHASLDAIVQRRAGDAVVDAEAAMKEAQGDEKLEALMELEAARAERDAAKADAALTHAHYTRTLHQMLDSS